MFKITVEGFLAHPIQTSAFITLFTVLLFLPLVKPPFILGIILLGGLVYLSMFFGALFTVKKK